MKKGDKKTEVGVIPEEWEVDKIKNKSSITTGSKNTQDRIDGGEFPFLFALKQLKE
jgi:type I restriction enzyme, S subunit